MSEAYAIGEHDRMIGHVAGRHHAVVVTVTLEHGYASATGSAYLPWHVLAAGGVRIWRAPSVGAVPPPDFSTRVPEAWFHPARLLHHDPWSGRQRDHVTVIHMYPMARRCWRRWQLARFWLMARRP